MNASMRGSQCRLCLATLTQTFVNLGVTPLCQTHVAPERLNEMEPFYPLHALVCANCLLVQLDEYVTPDDIFTEYAYFSSYSESWLEHASAYCSMITRRRGLRSDSMVVELASNDGYLLKNFVEAGIPCLGVEPAENVAEVAQAKGIRTVTEFFGAATARRIREEYGTADLIVGNNVLAHVPNLNDFVSGIGVLLAQSGIATLEFPHLLRLIEGNQFDTIYHEHFSYFSFLTAIEAFRRHGMTVFDVEELSTHGGSLRIYVSHAGAEAISDNVGRLLRLERASGLDRIEAYADFQPRVDALKRDLLAFLIDAKRRGKTVAGYGAPGKGNTLLNYCGISTDFLDYTVDRNPYKQGKYTPGCRIPIVAPSRISETRPDYVLILPWNLRDEIVSSNSQVAAWGGRFVVPVPALEIIDPI